MFNFTTTTLIHSLDLFAANPTTQAQGLFATDKTVGPSNNTFWVNGVNLFRKENVVAIYRSPYMDPLAGRLVVDFTNLYTHASSIAGVASGKVQIRLKFFLRRSGDNNSYYATEEIVKGKDFVYEWMMDGNTTAAQVAKQIKKINRLYGDIYFDVHVGTSKDNEVLMKYDTQDGSAFGQNVNDVIQEKSEEGCLVFVNDNYGLFTDATLEVWVDGHGDCCHYEDGQWKLVDEIDCYDAICVDNCSMTDCDARTRNIKASTDGHLHIVDCVNGVGTYEQILRDLRLPTMNNLAYGSLTQQMHEMPVPGMKYVQYTLHYIACRGILGGSAVGEVTHSKTTHVFFVPATCCQCENAGIVDIDAAFQQALNDAFGWSVCADGAPEGNLVPAPHDDPTLEPKYMSQLAPAAAGDTRTSNDTEPAQEGSEQTPEEPIGG